MSDTKYQALDLAVKAFGNQVTVAVAESFYDFLNGKEVTAPTSNAKVDKEDTKSPSKKAAAEGKPTATKPTATKPAAEVAPATTPAKTATLSEETLALKQRVAAKLTAMMEAGLRESASEKIRELGAKSATSLAEAGEEAVAAFEEFCDEAVLSA